MKNCRFLFNSCSDDELHKSAGRFGVSGYSGSQYEDFCCAHIYR